MAFDWKQYAVGGAQRPDSFTGLNPQFSSALEQLFASAPDNIRNSLRVGSGYRSPERQEQLWADALKKYGSPEAARKWVAPPGRSQHNHGHAADLKYLSDDARKWAHENAANFGLSFPLSNEDWHIELAGARGGKTHAPHNAAPSPSRGMSFSGDPVAEVLAAGSSPVMGSMAPTSAFSAASSTDVPQAVQNVASGAAPRTRGGDIFGMLAMAGNQPQFSPVQIMGPSAEQSQGLLNLLSSLRGRV